MKHTEIESKIIEALESIPNESRSGGWEWKRGQWTKLIKERLGAIADQHGFLAAASSLKGADQGEWLYDMVWYKKSNQYMSRVPLVLESELNNSDDIVDDDFFKLLLARADHRIWIFERKTPDQVMESFDECIETIKQFTHTQKGDRYLMFGIDWNPRNFQSKLYIH